MNTDVQISNDRIQELGGYLPGFQNMPVNFITYLATLHTHYLDKGDVGVNAFQKAWNDVVLVGPILSRLTQHFRLADIQQDRAA